MLFNLSVLRMVASVALSVKLVGMTCSRMAILVPLSTALSLSVVTILEALILMALSACPMLVTLIVAQFCLTMNFGLGARSSLSFTCSAIGNFWIFVVISSVPRSSLLDWKISLNWTGLNCKRPIFRSSPVQSSPVQSLISPVTVQVFSDFYKDCKKPV